jgi:hypothetical protein
VNPKIKVRQGVKGANASARVEGEPPHRVKYLTRLAQICTVLLLLESSAASQVLQIRPAEVRAGQAATLSWDTTGPPGFILGYGKVLGRGSATVSPESSGDFTLVVETKADIQYRTVRISVSGSRGDDGFPSLGDFEVAATGSHEGAGYTGFQGLVWDVLQHLGYGLKGDFAPKRPYVTIYTNFANRPDLVAKGDGIRARRLALAVDIYEPAKLGAVAFGVRPRLEFQYRGESDWRSDRESPQSRKEATDVVRLLEQAK